MKFAQLSWPKGPMTESYTLPLRFATEGDTPTSEQHHDHRHEMQPYERLLGLVLEDLGCIKEMIGELRRQVARNEQADKRRDEKAMALEDDILAKLAEAKTRDDGFRVLLKAIKDNQNNPAKLAQIAASIDENEGAWTSAFAEGVPPEPAPV